MQVHVEDCHAFARGWLQRKLRSTFFPLIASRMLIWALAPRNAVATVRSHAHAAHTYMSSGRAGAGYGLDQHRLAVSNALIVGYDAARNATRLPAHRDAALCTINVALSDEAEYEGGGTLIEASQQVGKRDHLLSHRPCRACR